MTESASPMHVEAQGAAPARPQAHCDACTRPFAVRKRWQRFCSSKCRNDWHGWTRTVREARELVRLALENGLAEPHEWAKRAQKLLGIK